MANLGWREVAIIIVVALVIIGVAKLRSRGSSF
jgi:Sec-independent protein translocase protein TatA